MKIIKVVFSTLFYIFSFLVIYNLLSLYVYHKDQDFENLNKQHFPSTGNASEKIRSEIINALHISQDGRPLSDPARIDTFLERNFSKDDILILGTSSQEIVFGFEQANVVEIKGGTPEENAEVLRRILNGERGAKRDIVVMNTAAAIVAANRASDFKEGAHIAQRVIDSGQAQAKLDELINFSQTI